MDQFWEVVVLSRLDEVQEVWRFFVGAHQCFRVPSSLHCDRLFSTDEKKITTCLQ